MHHRCNRMHKVLLQSLKNCFKQVDLPVLFDGLCLHILHFFGIGSNLCETYISSWKWKKKELLSNFYQLSQQLVKEIRHPACWLSCILMAESWQGGHSLSISATWTFKSGGFFSHFCQHTVPHNPGFSVHAQTHAHADVFMWLHVFTTVASRLSVEVFCL